MASNGEVVSEVAAQPNCNNENVSPPKKPKKEDLRAKLKEWQKEHGRAQGPVQPWQRPPRKQPLRSIKEATADANEAASHVNRKPFSFRQNNTVCAKVDCKWSADNNLSRQSARAKVKSSAEDIPASVLQLRGEMGNENPEKAGLQKVKSAVELLEKLPKAFDLAQWRAARRAVYAERVREQENKRRQTLAAAAAQHGPKPLPASAAIVRRQTMAASRTVNKSVQSTDGASSTTDKAALVNKGLASKSLVNSKWSIANSTQTSKPAPKEKKTSVSTGRNPGIVTKPMAARSHTASSAKTTTVAIVPKINVQPVPKPKPLQSKPSTSTSTIVKNKTGDLPKLKRLNVNSRLCSKKNTPPQNVAKSKVGRRRSAFKPVFHSRPQRRSPVVRATAKPNKTKTENVQKPLPKKQNGGVATKRRSVASRRSMTTQRISLTALHRKGGKQLVKAKEGLVREVKSALHKKQTDEIEDSQTQVPLSVKKARSVSFYVPIAEEVVPITPDERLRKSRLETWLQSKGRSAESFRHCRCFNDPVTPTLSASKSRSVKRRTPTPGRPKLTSIEDDSLEIPKTLSDDRRLTVDLTTLPLPLNWDPSPEVKISCSVQHSSPSPPGKPIAVELNNFATCEATSPLSVSSDLQVTLTELADSLQAGEPFFAVSERLDELCEASPQVQKITKYWLCRAEIAKQAGNYTEVLRLLQLAFDHGAEPISELLAAQEAIGAQLVTPSRRTPRRRRATGNPELLCESSVVKFKISTPSARKSLAGNIFAITPVRRSMRVTRAMAKTQKHAAEDAQCVDSVEELPAHMRKSVVYKPNDALSNWDITVEYVPNTDSSSENNVQ